MRLGPDAVADRDAARAVDLLCDPLEDRGAVVGLADDNHLTLRLRAEVEGCEHAGEEEDRLAAGTEQGAGDPAVGVVDLAEDRELTLDAGQVLEVGGRERKSASTPSCSSRSESRSCLAA